MANSVRQSPTNSNMWEVVFHPILAAPHRIILFYNAVPKFGVLDVPVKGPGTEPWAGGIGKWFLPSLPFYENKSFQQVLIH